MLLPNVSPLLMLLLISEAEAVLFASQISSSLGIYSLVLEGDAIYIYIYISCHSAADSFQIIEFCFHYL
jgi:hypothetical protein